MPFRKPLTAAIFLASFSSFAQTQPSAAIPGLKNCVQEIARFCPAVPPGRELFQCLIRRDADASEGCKQDIQRLSQVLKQGGGLSSFGGVMGGVGIIAPGVPMITYGGSHAPEGATRVEQHRGSISAPVYKDGTDTVSLSLSGNSLNFSEAPQMAGGSPVARDFTRLEAGAQYSRRLDEGQLFLLRTSAGSASDEPFGHSRDLTFTVTGSYGYPSGENRYWIFSVFLSNNAAIGNYIPIPGFMYFYRTERFTGLFGLPFLSLNWTPADPWALTLSVFGPSLTSEIIYGHRDRLQGFAGFSWKPETYLRSDRVEDDDRLILDEKKAYVGVRSPLSREVSAEVQAGHAFNRSFYEGEGLGDRDRGSADLGDSWFISWNLRYLFH